ncbi:hypothetical protein HK102_010325, partial [Quaeritorhiza haematococci]
MSLHEVSEVEPGSGFLVRDLIRGGEPRRGAGRPSPPGHRSPRRRRGSSRRPSPARARGQHQAIAEATQQDVRRPDFPQSPIVGRPAAVLRPGQRQVGPTAAATLGRPAVRHPPGRVGTSPGDRPDEPREQALGGPTAGADGRGPRPADPAFDPDLAALRRADAIPVLEGRLLLQSHPQDDPAVVADRLHQDAVVEGGPPSTGVLDAVTPGSLGLVEGAVGLGEDLAGGAPPVGNPRRAADAQGHGRARARRAVGEPPEAEPFAHDPRHGDGPDAVGLRKDGGELLAAVAGREVAGARDGSLDRPGDFPEAVVARQVAVEVVVLLEVIHVEEEDRERRGRSCVPVPFPRKRLIEVAAVAHAGQAVGGRLGLEQSVHLLEPQLGEFPLGDVIVRDHDVAPRAGEEPGDAQREPLVLGGGVAGIFELEDRQAAPADVSDGRRDQVRLLTAGAGGRLADSQVVHAGPAAALDQPFAGGVGVPGGVHGQDLAVRPEDGDVREQRVERPLEEVADAGPLCFADA